MYIHILYTFILAFYISLAFYILLKGKESRKVSLLTLFILKTLFIANSIYSQKVIVNIILLAAIKNMLP